MHDSFFLTQSPQSRAKAAIVSGYFSTWSAILQKSAKRQNGHQKVRFVDLFAGPGRYSDGAMSTPLLVLQHAIKSFELSQGLVSFFNDKDPRTVEHLRSAISQLPGIEKLCVPPRVHCSEFDDVVEEVVSNPERLPTLYFIDPYGYRPLSLELITKAVQPWGCECVFFFNFNRVNAGITNPEVEARIDAIFGKSLADSLRRSVGNKDSEEREAEVMSALKKAIQGVDSSWLVSQTRFVDEVKLRTSHYVVFVTKHRLGFNKMNEVMHRNSTGISAKGDAYDYCPSDETQGNLFVEDSLEDLEKHLLSTFAGRSITVKEI